MSWQKVESQPSKCTPTPSPHAPLQVASVRFHVVPYVKERWVVDHFEVPWDGPLMGQCMGVAGWVTKRKDRGNGSIMFYNDFQMLPRAARCRRVMLPWGMEGVGGCWRVLKCWRKREGCEKGRWSCGLPDGVPGSGIRVDSAQVKCVGVRAWSVDVWRGTLRG